MPFQIDFSAPKPARAVNENYHDEASWVSAHQWAAKNGWPVQYTVHYMYELMNRPWLSDVQQIDDVATLMETWCKISGSELKI